MYPSKQTKGQIEAFEMRIKDYEDYCDKIDLIKANKDDQKGIELLLDIQKLEFEGRMERGKSELAFAKSKFIAEFENDSAEANQEIDALIPKIAAYIGKDPVGVTQHIKPLIDAYESEKENITQDRRNDIYFELKSHYLFLINKHKV